MKKKLIMSTTTLALSLAMSTSVFASPLVVSINGVERVFVESVIDNEIVTVNAEELAKKLSLEYSVGNPKGTVTFKDDKTTLVLTPNSTLGTLNGKQVSLPVAPKFNENEELYVPINFVIDAFGIEASEANDESDFIENDFDTPYFSDLTGISGITEETKVYTYREALDLAEENNSAIKKSEIEYDYYKDEANSINNSMSYLNDYYSQNGGMPETMIPFYNGSLEAAYQLTLKTNDVQERMDVLELATESGLMISLNNLTNANINYTLTKESYEIQEQDLEFTRVKNDLGLVSDYNLQKSEAALVSTRTTLTALENQVQAAKRDLNTTLGLDVDDDTYVETSIEVKPVDYDIKNLVSDALYYSYQLQQSKDALEDTRDDEGSDSVKYKVEKITHDDLKKSVEKSVYTAYDNFNNIVANDKLLRSERETAVNDYNMALQQYKLGYITSYDLDKLLLNIANKDAAILKNEMNYKLVRFQLDNPELF